MDHEPTNGKEASKKNIGKYQKDDLRTVSEWVAWVRASSSTG